MWKTWGVPSSSVMSEPRLWVYPASDGEHSTRESAVGLHSQSLEVRYPARFHAMANDRSE